MLKNLKNNYCEFDKILSAPLIDIKIIIHIMLVYLWPDFTHILYIITILLHKRFFGHGKNCNFLHFLFAKKQNVREYFEEITRLYEMNIHINENNFVS